MISASLKPPRWKEHPEPALPPVIPPASFVKWTLHWPADYRPIPVFVAQFELSGGRDVYLFGVRFNFAHASRPDGVLPNGHFVEYLVLEFVESAPRWHRLCQHRGPVYSAAAEKNDFLLGSDLRKKIGDLVPWGSSPVEARRRCLADL